MRTARQAEAAAHGGLIAPPPAAIFGVTDPTLADWITARSTLQPMSTYAEPVPTGNAASAALPRIFIHCTGNPITSRRLFNRFADQARTVGWQV